MATSSSLSISLERIRRILFVGGGVAFTLLAFPAVTPFVVVCWLILAARLAVKNQQSQSAYALVLSCLPMYLAIEGKSIQ